MKKMLLIVVLLVCFSGLIVNADSLITPEQTSFINSGANLFDESKVVLDNYVNWGTGELCPNWRYAASDYIPVQSSQQYTFTGFNRGMAFYDSTKTFISGTEYPSSTITTPANSCYMRVTPYKSGISTFQVEKGSVSTDYKPFQYVLNGVVPKSDEFKLFLPSEICVAVGRTIEIYNSQVSWCGNIDNYHFSWYCSIGKAMKRKFSITGTTLLIGEYPLYLTVYDNNMNIIDSANTTLKIVGNMINSNKTILCIGDSLSNNKAWLGELRALSDNKFIMAGTRGAFPLNHEGRSGFSAVSYLTNAAYVYENEGVHPFWDGSRFNWNYYKTQTGINPDAVQIFLGTNNMELDPTTNAGNIKQIVDYIRQDSSIPIFVVYTLFRGNQDGIGNEIDENGHPYTLGTWKLEEDRKVFNLMVKLNELLNAYTNLHFVPVSICHDSEYNFGAVETPVNPRATQTELLPSQATHPKLQGYLQMADIMFSVYAKYLNN
jgi:hypothetical protein